MTERCREAVAALRLDQPLIEDADVFTSPGGDALVWVRNSVIHVSTVGKLSGTPVVFSPIRQAHGALD